MTDRTNYLTVVLEKDLRIDDAAPLIEAIKMLRGVISVEPNVADPDNLSADHRARYVLGQRLWEVIYPKTT